MKKNTTKHLIGVCHNNLVKLFNEILLSNKIITILFKFIRNTNRQ